MILNHLWQSTMFAVVVALLSLFFRQNSARVRYFLWTAASFKFLVPFSLITSVGSYLGLRHSPGIKGPLFVVIGQAVQPFGIDSTVVSMAATRSQRDIALMIVWISGAAFVFLRWWISWKKARTVLSESEQRQSGREFQILTGLAGNSVAIALSGRAVDPGVFGLLRPVVLLSERTSHMLDDAEFEAVIAHELCHVRRHDNVVIALHKIVEGVFWFHPLVWWLGAQLVIERERVCDEAVLWRGIVPRIYAEA